MLYLDTSAFLKVLVEEEHSRPLRRALNRAEVWSSALLALEAHRAALRLGIAAADVDLRLAAVTLIVASETIEARHSRPRVGAGAASRGPRTRLVG